MLESHVAAAGVVVPQSKERLVRQIVGATDAVDVLPLVSRLVGMERFHVLHFGMPSTLKPKVSAPTRLTTPIEVWVQQCDVSFKPIPQPFKVTPAGSVVDDLKKAIKAEVGPKYPSLIAPDITILNPGTTTVANPGQPWGTSTAGEPYLFELPKPQS